MRKTIPLAVAVIIFAGLVGGGCSKREKSDQGTAHSGTLTIKGSDTMVHLVTGWAEAYMKAHPNAQVSVTGGGSGTGIAAMLNGTADLCMASRDVKAKERELAKGSGITFREIAVARDGIAVVVHPQNPVSELTMDQLRQIFNGTLQNWKQVGGPDSGIQVLSRTFIASRYALVIASRRSSSGTRPSLRPRRTPSSRK